MINFDTFVKFIKETMCLNWLVWGAYALFLLLVILPEQNRYVSGFELIMSTIVVLLVQVYFYDYLHRAKTL